MELFGSNQHAHNVRY